MWPSFYIGLTVLQQTYIIPSLVHNYIMQHIINDINLKINILTSYSMTNSKQELNDINLKINILTSYSMTNSKQEHNDCTFNIEFHIS